jgi:hypothetical protein
MEDASGVDLDWFWRGWFYGTEKVNIAVDEVKWFKLRSDQPNLENKGKSVQAGDLNVKANGPSSEDFSQGPQPFTLLNTPDQMYGEFRGKIDDNEIRKKLEGKNIYQVKFRNIGGLVMPLVIEWTFKDGSKEIERIPAEIWRINENEITKVFVKEKEVVSMVLDPNFEIADVDMSDNAFPKKKTESRFDQFKKDNK